MTQQICPIRFVSSRTDEAVFRILVFTISSYSTMIKERGRNYVFEMFIEICREKRCNFLGLKTEGSFVYALIGIDVKNNEKDSSAGREQERGSGAYR